MIVMAALLLLDVMLSSVFVWAMPAQIPVHWNSRGEIDRYGSPWELAIVFPVIIAVVAGLLIALSSVARSSLERSGRTYGRIAIAIITTIVGLHAVTFLAAANRPINVISAVLFVIGLLWLALGNWMGKLRRNAIVGIRTPWTLKSDFVWERTHRLGGRVGIALGVVIMLAAVLLPSWSAFVVFLAGSLAISAWAMIYSWRLYRAAAGVSSDSATK
jgi:uncharacterized membrane protein